MSDAKRAQAKRSNIGCLIAVVATIIAIVGGGIWLGRRSAANQTPCDVYVATVKEALKSCYSGQTKNTMHHWRECERFINPTPTCLRVIESLSCDQLERGVLVVSGEACARNSEIAK